MDDPEIDAAARHADMRIQVVLREINQGALEGFGYQSEISEYAARLIIAALDAFDYDALQRAWGDGFRAGQAFERVRRQPDFGCSHGCCQKPTATESDDQP